MATTTQSRLEALPAELKNSIFALALAQLNPIQIRLIRDPNAPSHACSRHRYGWHPTNRDKTILALTAVSKKIRQGTLAMFWHLNHFEVLLSGISAFNAHTAFVDMIKRLAANLRRLRQLGIKDIEDFVIDTTGLDEGWSRLSILLFMDAGDLAVSKIIHRWEPRSHEDLVEERTEVLELQRADARDLEW